MGEKRQLVYPSHSRKTNQKYKYLMKEDMNYLYEKQLLIFCSKLKQPLELTVEGTSMLPILHPGDSISISSKEDYKLGDILVFFYKNSTLLVHRLLKIENGRYFCKGDNSFRLEDIEKSAILGAVELASDTHNTPEFISASYAINQVFRHCGYDAEKTKLTPEYIFYVNSYLSNT